MTDTSSNNKRIAKNTMFLYIRMLFLMFVMFFTSRILLQQLGVEDYGIYNVVGSVVAIFSSIQGLLASSTQRFLNFEHGRGDKDQLNKIFSMSVWIHIGLSLLFLVVILPIGLWVINNYLVIPEKRMIAANWVFVFSILSAIVTIMTVPYNAVIIANEKMSAFAYISILDGGLRLIIIYLLTYSIFDQLIIYSILLFIIGLIIRVINMLYCSRNFEEAKSVKLMWDKKLLNEMSSFAGWQFFGNSGGAVQSQGLNMVLNIFYGPLYNASRGIAEQVNGGLALFVNNMMLAINPQMTKLYAQSRYDEYMNLFFLSSKLSFFIFTIISLPVILCLDVILDFWLEEVPPNTSIFVFYLLFYTMIRSLYNPFDGLLKSCGKIKKYQISSFICMLLTIPIVYIGYTKALKVEFMYIGMIIMQVVAWLNLILITKKTIKFNIPKYFKKVIIPCVLNFIVLLLILYGAVFWNQCNKINYAFMALLIYTIAIYVLGFNEGEKNIVIKKFKNIYK